MEKPVKKRKARVGFTDEKDLLLLRAVLNQNPWQQGDKQWQKVANEIKDKFEADITIRTVRGRLNTLIKNFNSNELKYKSGVAEEEESEMKNLLRIIIAIEEEEKAAMRKQVPRKALAEVTQEVPREVVKEVARDVPIEVAGDVPIEVAGEIPREIVGDASNNIQIEYVQYVDLGGADDEDYLIPQVGAAKRRLERAEADLERKRYLDEASEPSTSRKSCQRTEKARAMKREEHEMQLEKSKFEMEKQRSDEKLQLEKERLALEKCRESRKEREAERRDEMSKMSIDLQSKMMELLTKVLEK